MGCNEQILMANDSKMMVALELYSAFGAGTWGRDWSRNTDEGSQICQSRQARGTNCLAVASVASGWWEMPGPQGRAYDVDGPLTVELLDSLFGPLNSPTVSECTTLGTAIEIPIRAVMS